MSHLLVAILRYLQVPTGFCFHGIKTNNKVVIPGLNAIYLKSIGKWIRVDGRGNKQNITAEFSITAEKLAYKNRSDVGEFADRVIYSKPDDNVIDALIQYKSANEVIENLPNKLAYMLKA